ncbi:MAG: hypothetical protein ACKVOP_07620 [Sphingomonadaceae bacterium]
MDADKIRELVTEVAREQFGNVGVERVEAELDEDADGDPIWRVLLVLSTTKTLEGRKLSGFARHVLARFDDREPFPILTFRSAADDRRSRPAAA